MDDRDFKIDEITKDNGETRFIISTTDEQEAKRLVKSLDMAIALFDIEFNGWRRYKHQEPITDFVTAYKEIIRDILEQNNININDLID